MPLKVNDFRNKTKEEVFDMYKKIALKDYIYNELWNITKNNEEIQNFYNINNEGIQNFYNINNEEKNNE